MRNPREIHEKTTKKFLRYASDIQPHTTGSGIDVHPTFEDKAHLEAVRHAVQVKKIFGNYVKSSDEPVHERAKTSKGNKGKGKGKRTSGGGKGKRTSGSEDDRYPTEQRPSKGGGKGGARGGGKGGYKHF